MNFKSYGGHTLNTGQKAKYLPFLILALKVTFSAIYGKSLRVSALIDLYFPFTYKFLLLDTNYPTPIEHFNSIEYTIFLLPGKSTFSLCSMIHRFVTYICRLEEGI